MFKDTVLISPQNCFHQNTYRIDDRIVCYDCLLVLGKEKSECHYYVESGRKNLRSMKVVRKFANDWPRQYVQKLIEMVREHHPKGGRDNKTLMFFCKNLIAEKYNLSFSIEENLEKIGIKYPSQRKEQ